MPSLRLDHAGIREILRSPEVASLIHAKAEEVAGAVRAAAGDAAVVVDDYTTDRAASSVTIRDPRGAQLQAEQGVLTRAAASAGLEVTERTP